MTTSAIPVFETGAFNHSATPPRVSQNEASFAALRRGSTRFIGSANVPGHQSPANSRAGHSELAFVLGRSLGLPTTDASGLVLSRPVC